MKYLKLPPKAQVAIVYRSNTPKAKHLALKLIRQLAQKKAHVVTAPEQEPLVGAPLCDTKTFQKSHLVLALGGDGTYLRANRLLKGASVPILGVHLGALGFLTPTRASEASKMLELAFKGDLALIPRSMIRVEFKHKGKSLFNTLSLNDVVVERGEQSQLIHLSVHCGNTWVTNAKADGVVIASPLGSTAYNLAVGGPLLHPESKAFALSLIAPHALTARPLVLPDSSKIHVSIVKNGLTQVCGRLVVDGRIMSPVQGADEVILTRSSKPHWLVRLPEINEFQILRDKLKFGERT